MLRKKTWNTPELGYDDVGVNMKKNDTILVTMGSCQKHGSHCPLGTDTFAAVGVVGWYKTPTERTFSLIADIVEGPPEETPGWHAGEVETSTAWAYNEGAMAMERAVIDKAHAPKWMGSSFSKHDGSGFVTFMGAESMWVPMEHHEYSDTATIG
ncbi:MAG: hypothetical protein ACOCW6_09685, partial [Spirochaetota bacterium]